MSQPPLLRCYPAWTDHAGGQLRGRPELAESCFCFCQSQALSSNTHTPSRGRCARAQTKPEEFLFLPSQVRDRRGCTMRPSDSTSYTMRRRSCKPCSAGVLIVNPDALSLRFSALTFRLKVNLSVCSMCLKKSSKPPCRGAPHRFCWIRLQHSYATLGGKRGGGETAPLPLALLGCILCLGRGCINCQRGTLSIFGRRKQRQEAASPDPHPHPQSLAQQWPERTGRPSKCCRAQACLIFSLSFNFLPT